MIYSLHGTLINKQQDCVVVECGGVGYSCLVTFNTLKQLPEIGKEVFLYTFMTVREDAVTLTGFYEQSELDCFKLLTSITGVGAKMAVAILSELRPEEIAAAVLSSDVNMLTKVSGVGKKIAQRIILELNDKVTKAKTSSSNAIESMPINYSGANVQNALDALSVLGYSPSDVTPIISKFDASLSTEQLITLTLRELGKK